MGRLRHLHHLWLTFTIIILLLFVARDPQDQTATHAQSNAQNRPTLLLPAAGHTDTITAMAYSPNGRLIASSSADNTIRLWLVDEGINIRTLSENSSVESIDFSPDGKLLASGGYDNVLRVWDVESGKVIRSFPNHVGAISSVKFSPDGKLLASGSWDAAIKLWDVASGRLFQSFYSSGSVLAINFSPNGRMLAGTGDNGTIMLWETQTRRELGTLRGHTDSVGTIAFTPDGNMLATGSADDTIRLWDLKTQKLIRTFTGHAAAVSSLAFSPDGKLLASGSEDRTVKLWNPATGSELRSLKDQAKGVTAVVFSPDGRSLASGSNRTINLWSVADGSLQKTLESHAHAISSVAFNNNGTLLASGTDENTIKIWDLKQGKLIRSLRAHTNVVTSITFSPDGRTLASGSADNTVRLWDTATGLLVHTLAGHSSSVSSVSFSPDGKSIASGSFDTSIKIWEAASGRELRTFNYNFPVTAVRFNPKGTMIAGGTLLQINLTELETGEKKTLTADAVVYEMTFSPDGNTLAVATLGAGAELWNLASGEKVRTLMEKSSIAAVSFSRDGKFLAIGDSSGSIGLWDVQGAKMIFLSRQPDPVTSIAFNPSGEQLASGSEHGAIRLWDVNERRELAQLLAVDEKDWIVNDSQGRVDASPNSERLIYWSIRNDLISFDQLKAHYYDPGLLAKVFNDEPLRSVVEFRNTLYPEAQLKEIAKGSKELRVTLKNRGGGIGRVQVFVNGKEYVEDARSEELKRNPNVPLTTLRIDLSRVPVVADNVVRVVTWNVENSLANRGAEINWHLDTKPNQEWPNFYAIVGGISEYAGKDLRLRYAANDAEVVAKALELGAKRLFGPNRVHITLLTTGDHQRSIAATKENFRKTFDSVAKSAKAGDEIVVYLAGHGWAESQGGADTYFYLTQEANVEKATSLADEQLRNRISISSNELAQWINVIPALKQVLILDTCGAGAGRAVNLSEKRDVPASQVRALARLHDRTGAWMLMGSAADSASYEASQYGSGLMTHVLLEGMRGAALREQMFVDVFTLFQHVQERVPHLAEAIGGIQIPVVFSPLQNNSFYIGMLTAKDRAAIPVSAAKPLVLRPTFINELASYDDLFITPSVRNELVKESSSRIIFVDVDEMPQAIRPTGNYSVLDGKVTLKLRLVRDNRVISSVNVEGATNNLQRFVALVTDAIIQEITDMERLPVVDREELASSRRANRQTHHHLLKKITIMDQANSGSFLIVRPSIYNRKPGAGDDLNLRDEVIKGLKDWSADKSDPVSIEFKDVDTLQGAYQFEGTYERSARGYLRLSLSVKLNGVILVQPTPSVCDSADRTRVAGLFIEMAHIAMGSLPIKRGTDVVQETDLKVLNYKIRSYALLIATNVYEEKTGWKSLANPICDAEAIKRELVEHYGFDEKADVFTAYNQDYDGVWNSIDAFHKQVYAADEDTELFVFIAGHGIYDEQRKKGMLALRNSRVDDPKGNNYYRFTNLLEDISALPFNHIFVIIDACQSGDAINDSSDRAADPNNRSDAQFILDKLKNKKTRKAFTSASYNSVDDGPIGGHSPFAEKLLEAFRMYGSNDRFLTIDEIWTLGGMDRLTTNPRHGWFKGNTPGSDFLFIAQPKVKDYQCMAGCNCN